MAGLTSAAYGGRATLKHICHTKVTGLTEAAQREASMTMVRAHLCVCLIACIQVCTCQL
jgi:hypothetical protein